MKIYVNVKKAGSRKMALAKQEYEIPFENGTLRNILTFFVETEVDKYNNRDTNEVLLYLTQKDIEEVASLGKVSFNTVLTDRKASINEAIENAMSCYEDGLIKVFQNDKELEKLDESVTINDSDIFTFIRLTFLTGRSW